MDLVDKINGFMKIGDTVTISSLMRKFKATRTEVENAVEDLKHDVGGYDLIVGVRAGSGHAFFKRTEYEVERYE
jgi:hypothetical protein